jgi:thioredoxin-related protein
MDAVTYPHPDVRRELTGWLQRRADVVDEPELATIFEVAAIPTAVLLSPDGRILDRVVGFVQPEDFLARLSSAADADSR